MHEKTSEVVQNAAFSEPRIPCFILFGLNKGISKVNINFSFYLLLPGLGKFPNSKIPFNVTVPSNICLKSSLSKIFYFLFQKKTT